MVFGWWVNFFLSIAALTLRIFKILRKSSFGYVLVGAINLLMGGLDCYFLAVYRPVEIHWVLIGLTPLIFSVIILIDFLLQRN